MGDLAPFLLTALRRKLQLIIAGDVETNPGPGTNLIIFKVSTSFYMHMYIVDVYAVYIIISIR